MKRMTSYYCGNAVCIDENPIEAVEHCMAAGSGKSSKSGAWQWADDATKIVREFFSTYLEKWNEELGRGPFPVFSFDIRKVLGQREAAPKPSYNW